MRLSAIERVLFALAALGIVYRIAKDEWPVAIEVED